MPKRPANPWTESPTPFPLGGIDDSVPFCKQPNLTTPNGLNVRSVDPVDDRARGGSRPGTSKLREVPPTPAAAACTPGGGTSWDEAEGLGNDGSQSVWNLGSGEHWFRVDTVSQGSQDYNSLFSLSSQGQAFFAVNADTTWRVLYGDGESEPVDKTDLWGEHDYEDHAEVYSQDNGGGVPDTPAIYMVVTVPDGCRPLTLEYHEYALS